MRYTGLELCPYPPDGGRQPAWGNPTGTKDFLDGTARLPTYFGEVPVDKFFQLRANFLVRQNWHFGNRITRHKLRLEAGDAIWGGQRFKRMGQVSLHID